MIRCANAETDSSDLADIYNHYIRDTSVTFETTEITPKDMEGRIRSVMEKGFPFFVYECDSESREILGYCYATTFKARAAYDQTVETTVYTKQGSCRKGIGTQLYTKLIEQLRANNFHVLIGIITLPNEPSVRIHQDKFGFKKVAHLEEVGWKFGRWWDVGMWHLKL